MLKLHVYGFHLQLHARRLTLWTASLTPSTISPQRRSRGYSICFLRRVGGCLCGAIGVLLWYKYYMYMVLAPYGQAFRADVHASHMPHGVAAHKHLAAIEVSSKGVMLQHIPMSQSPISASTCMSVANLKHVGIATQVEWTQQLHKVGCGYHAHSPHGAQTWDSLPR